MSSGGAAAGWALIAIGGSTLAAAGAASALALPSVRVEARTAARSEHLPVGAMTGAVALGGGVAVVLLTRDPRRRRDRGPARRCYPRARPGA